MLDDGQKSDQPIAVNDYEVDGVPVALLSVKRISDGSLTVKWEYRNKTNEPKPLGESFDEMGSSEAYSLVWHAYLADSRHKIKVSCGQRSVRHSSCGPAWSAQGRSAGT